MFVDFLSPFHVADIIVAFCHKFQFIPPMAFALSDDTNGLEMSLAKQNILIFGLFLPSNSIAVFPEKKKKIKS